MFNVRYQTDVVEQRMKIEDIQNITIQKILFLTKIVLLSLLLNIVCEYNGPVTVWTKFIRYIKNNDLNKKEFRAKEVVSYLKRHIYGEFSDIKLYPGKPLFLSQLYIFLEELHIKKLIKYFPVDYRVKHKQSTGKPDYDRERRMYKICHQIASSGGDIKTHYYEEYKSIANKYNWPFIVNSDDPEY